MAKNKNKGNSSDMKGSADVNDTSNSQMQNKSGGGKKGGGQGAQNKGANGEYK